METSSSNHRWGDILRETIYHSLQVLGDKTVSSHNFTFPWVLIAICVSGSWRAAFKEKRSSIRGSFSLAAPYKQDVFSWCVPDMHIGVHILETATCTQPSSTASLLFLTYWAVNSLMRRWSYCSLNLIIWADAEGNNGLGIKMTLVVCCQTFSTADLWSSEFSFQLTCRAVPLGREQFNKGKEL